MPFSPSISESESDQIQDTQVEVRSNGAPEAEEGFAIDLTSDEHQSEDDHASSPAALPKDECRDPTNLATKLLTECGIVGIDWWVYAVVANLIEAGVTAWLDKPYFDVDFEEYCAGTSPCCITKKVLLPFTMPNNPRFPTTPHGQCPILQYPVY
jgi:hypothetical protein